MKPTIEIIVSPSGEITIDALGFKGPEDAVRDGRVVLRIAGKRYPRQAVRVTDPELLATLRSQLEEMAGQWVAPEPLGEAPTDGPRDIWFFRMDPRPPS